MNYSFWESCIKIEADKIKRISCQDNEELISELNQISLSMSSIFDENNGKFFRIEYEDDVKRYVHTINDVNSEWESTFLAINISSVCIMDIILCGYYLIGYASVRQELEGLAQLAHIISKRRSDPLAQKKAPSIAHLDEQLKRVYNRISGKAHLAKKEDNFIQSEIYGNNYENHGSMPSGASIIHKYMKDECRELLSIHLGLRKELYNELRSYLERIKAHSMSK